MAVQTQLQTKPAQRFRRPRLTRLQLREALEGYLFISPWLVGLLAFTLGPIVLSFALSFTAWQISAPPIWIGLDNYTELFQDPTMYKSLYNTIYLAVLGVPLSMVLALGIAMLMNQGVRGISIFRTIWFLPSVLSSVAVAVLWSWILNPRYGLLNRALALVGIDGPGWLTEPEWAKPAVILMGLWGVGGSMVIYLAGLKGIPQHLYEAAKLDGAGEWAQFRHVTLPMLSPTIFFNLITSVIGSLQVFVSIAAITMGASWGGGVSRAGGPDDSLLVFMLYLYRQAFGFFRMGYASALAWFLAAIIMALTIINFQLAKRWVYYEGQLRGRQ
ncbi:MAG: sugar ABC transporter permease [Chloroflexi bacterium]|nr:sugar ABC transporter permease [Chloroflexota bacterium]